jgi:head-tail adaptor
MGAGNRPHGIVIQRQTVTGQDAFGADIVDWSTWTTEYSAIFYGSGREQREAAQENASQSASFEVLSHSKTRAISVTDRLCYPVTDPDPTNWPVWDIQAVNDIDFNKGVRVTATRAAT